MTTERKFDELLSEAPLAAKEDTITLVGALQRSHEPGKFVLAMGGGRNVTLDVAAVKEHQVLGGAVGQRLVRLEVDRKKVPNDVQGMPLGPQPLLASPPAIDYGAVAKSPLGEFSHMGTYVEHIGNWGDPYGVGISYGGINPGAVAATPFALATPHHVPAGTMARLYSGLPSLSIPWWTEHVSTIPEIDYNRKVATNPSDDIPEGGTIVFYDV